MAADGGHSNFVEMITGLFSTAAERINAALAAGAILFQFWHPTLKDTSEVAGLAAPILGCLWLVVQIVAKIGEIVYRRRGADDG